MVRPRRLTASSRTQKARIDPLPSGAAKLYHLLAADCLSVSRPLVAVARLVDARIHLSVITSLIATKEVSICLHGLRLPKTCYVCCMLWKSIPIALSSSSVTVVLSA